MEATALNLRHVRALAAAVKTGSLSGAATALGVTQPAVTQAIGRLEALTGTQLLDRSRAGVTATDGGLLLAARAEAAAAALAAAFRPFRQGGTGGRAGADRDISMAQLHAFLALADSGSYVAGAAASGLTQPSLHRAVGDLERLCGIALVERRGRGVGLTAAGLRLARAFRLATSELEAALDELAVLSGRDQGAIRISAAPAALHRLLPNAAARFLQAHAPVRLELEEAVAPAAGDRLRDGLVDVLIGGEDMVGADDGVAAEPLLDVQHWIVTRTDHPLAGTKPGPARLAGFGWALPGAGADEYKAWEKMFLDGGLYPPPAQVTSPAAAALKLVARSDLLTLASAEAVEASGLPLARIGDPVRGARLMLFHRRDWYPTPAQATFLDDLRAEAAALASF
jgi:DNA-binding transcriptional LysR family regulator